MREAIDRAHALVNASPNPSGRDVRIKLLEGNDGLGPLLKSITSFGFGERREILPVLLGGLKIMALYQICIRKRSEFAALEHVGGGPMFHENDLDQIVLYLQQFDLSFAPE